MPTFREGSGVGLGSILMVLNHLEGRMEYPVTLKAGDGNIPRRLRGRPRKYIDGSQTLGGEAGVSSDTKMHGDSNAAGVSTFQVIYRYHSRSGWSYTAVRRWDNLVLIATMEAWTSSIQRTLYSLERTTGKKTFHGKMLHLLKQVLHIEVQHS